MKLVPIQVKPYAGHKADESPLRFFWQNRWIEIRQITDRWRQGGGDPEWPVADYFKVLTDDRQERLLKHDIETDEWHLVSKPWTRCGSR